MRIWHLLKKVIILYLSFFAYCRRLIIYMSETFQKMAFQQHIWKKEKTAASNASNFSFHEHSCYIYIFNIKKNNTLFDLHSKFNIEFDNWFFSYIPFLILNFVTSTILGNPPILGRFPYSILKMTRNKKNSSSSILRMGRNSIAYSQNQY